MAYFPFFMDMEQMKGLVIGGGVVASRKIRLLLPFEADLHVVAAEALPELVQLAQEGRIHLSVRKFDWNDLEGMDYVVAASSDEALNRSVSERCKERRIPINVVDVKEECSFIFPSLVQDGCITAGISTGGNSPYLAKYLKQRVREAIPEGIGQTADMLGAFRPMVKERIKSQKVREQIFTELAELVLGGVAGVDAIEAAAGVDAAKPRELTEAEVEAVIQKHVKNNAQIG
ncbi:MAG: bifunctional precorrin-2 dehydrogenase/sirohydrochlorin ferrochelatase [Lachnospiraceae bacterium]|nr:bifunctional precorrin-2 dehydrogenase/sirohydrochlorin ferrochelatase [Lachnospiraceae bacterium]